MFWWLLIIQKLVCKPLFHPLSISTMCISSSIFSSPKIYNRFKILGILSHSFCLIWMTYVWSLNFTPASRAKPLNFQSKYSILVIVNLNPLNSYVSLHTPNIVFTPLKVSLIRTMSSTSTLTMTSHLRFTTIYHPR